MSDQPIKWPPIEQLPKAWEVVESKGFTISRVVMNPVDVKSFQTTYAENFGPESLIGLWGSRVIATDTHPQGSMSLQVEPVGLPLSPVEFSWVPGKELQLPPGALSDIQVLPEYVTKGDHFDENPLPSLADAWALIEREDHQVSHVTMSHNTHLRLRRSSDAQSMLDIIDPETSHLWGAKVSSRSIADNVVCLYGENLETQKIESTVIMKIV